MKFSKKMCLLMVTASTTLMASGPDEAYSFSDHEVYTASDVTKFSDDYPNKDVLHSIYKELIRQDVIRVGEGVLSMLDPFEQVIIDDDILKNVYDWALENDLVTLSDEAFISQDIKPGDFDYFNTEKRFWSCLGAVVSCTGEFVAAEALGSSLACVAAAAEAGANPWADAWCAARLTAVGVTAGAACIGGVASVCRGRPDTSGLNLGRVGGGGGKTRNGYCSGNGRVHKFDIWSRSGIVTKIKAYCNDGSQFTVGTGNGSMVHRKCNNIGLVSGIYGRSGSKIDQVGIYCDAVTYSGKYYSPQGSGGGNGGSSFRLKCPSGEGYLHGLEAKETGHWIKKKRRMISLAPICK